MSAVDVASNPVARWHALLRLLAVFNIALWGLAAFTVTQEHARIDPATQAACQVQLLLSALYVLGCAYRSVFLVYDIPRLVLVDSRLSSVLVGRSVATIAELSFALQWALILHRVAFLDGSPFGQAAAWVIVPLIVLAEVFSWHAVLTTAQRGHVFENSLWGISSALLVASILLVGLHQPAALYPLTALWCVGGLAYSAFIFVFDVPMYWTRWRADQAAGCRYLSVRHGLTDLWTRRTVSYLWSDWKGEVGWMSLYFTFGVWSSISLVYACLSLGGRG